MSEIDGTAAGAAQLLSGRVGCAAARAPVRAACCCVLRATCEVRSATCDVVRISTSRVRQALLYPGADGCIRAGDCHFTAETEASTVAVGWTSSRSHGRLPRPFAVDCASRRSPDHPCGVVDGFFGWDLLCATNGRRQRRLAASGEISESRLGMWRLAAQQSPVQGSSIRMSRATTGPRGAACSRRDLLASSAPQQPPTHTHARTHARTHTHALSHCQVCS